MTNVINLLGIKKTVILLLIVSALAVMSVAIPVSRVLKRDKEIERIKEKEYRFDLCMQYALVVTKEGWFPCYNCPEGKIYMYVGEVWKYGKTCLDEAGRYPGGLPRPFLTFKPQYYGTEKDCLIMEKEKIYAYPTLPECLKRSIKLLRPPGNKIDR